MTAKICEADVGLIVGLLRKKRREIVNNLARVPWSPRPGQTTDNRRVRLARIDRILFALELGERRGALAIEPGSTYEVVT